MPGNRERRCREIGRGDAGIWGQEVPGYGGREGRDMGAGGAGIWGQGRPGYGERRCRDMGAGKAGILGQEVPGYGGREGHYFSKFSMHFICFIPSDSSHTNNYLFCLIHIL